jgi:hypothetical protein
MASLPAIHLFSLLPEIYWLMISLPANDLLADHLPVDSLPLKGLLVIRSTG